LTNFGVGGVKMSEFWMKVLFVAFFLGPIWSAGGFYLADKYIKEDYAKKITMTLFGHIFWMTLVGDAIFGLFRVFSVTLFSEAWYFMWGGPGTIWWIWTAAGFIIASIFVRLRPKNNDETYVSWACLASCGVIIAHYLMVFVLYLASGLAKPG
jgi:hypothetical protein